MTNENDQQTSNDNGAENVGANDSTNTAGEQDTTSEELESLRAENARLKAEQAIKARHAKKANKSEGSTETTQSESSDNQSFGYGEKAFINSLGYTDSSDHAYIQEAMAETGKSLDEVLDSKFVQAELKERAEDRKTQAATETTTQGRKTQTSSKTEVDYWIKKGELPEDTTLKRKVIAKRAENARAEGGRGKFNN